MTSSSPSVSPKTQHSASYRLGVDLGTTYTAAAVSGGGAPSMVGLGNRALQIPSVVFLNDDGEFLVGEAAERRGVAEPDRLVREFKRRIGDHVPILVAGSPYSPQALTARLLRWVVDITTERMGGAPASVVLTHPANWGPYKLDLFRQTGRLADLDAVHTCPEPQAAAAQYAGRNRIEPGDRVAVYDLGGGTFDVCVLEQTVDGFGLLGTPEGIEQLGGVDFDEALFQQVTASFGGRLYELDPEDPAVTVGLSRLRRDCVEAKEALSTDVDAVVPVTLPGLTTSVRVTRSEFESLIRPALRDTVAATNRALRSAGVQPKDLSAIVLVGGSSRIPLVGEVLQREFGVPTALDAHPKHDVAMGALLARLDVVPTPGPPPSESVPAPVATPAPRPEPIPVSEPTPVTAATIPPQRDSAPTKAPPEDSTVEPESDATNFGNSAAAATTFEPAQGGHARAGLGRRRLALMGVCAGIVAAVVVVLIVRYQHPEAVQGPGVASGPGSQGIRAATLPRSTPLTDAQMVVPMQVAGNWDLYLADTGSDRPIRRLTTSPAADYTPVLSPDFSTVIYVHDPDVNDGVRTLRVAAASDGSGDRELFNPVPSVCTGMMYRPAWDPADPSRLAVPCTDKNGKWGLYLIRLDGTVEREVHQGQQRVDDPTFSPDGRSLAFWAGPQSGFDGGSIFVARTDGRGTARQLTKTTLPGQDADPAWSPDGRSIVFRRRVVNGTTGGNMDIYAVPVNRSGEPEPLIDGPADEQDPSWSRYGKKIAYKSDAKTKQWPNQVVSRVWTANKDGSGAKLLWSVDAEGAQTAPAWSRR